MESIGAAQSILVSRLRIRYSRFLHIDVLFFSLLQASRKLDEMKMLSFAMIVSYMIGNLSDSLLFYSGSGYFFIFFMAIFLGEELEIKNKHET